MLKARIIPIVQLHGSSVVKTINFKNFRIVGDAISTVKIFTKRMADEMMIIDIMASQTKKINFKFLNRLTKECFMPLTIGGGIKNEQDVDKLFEIGADKIIVNSLFFENISELKKIILKYGSQAVIFSLDLSFKNKENIFFSNSKKNDYKKYNMETIIEKLNKIKVGEVLFNSVDRDGTKKGYDYELIKKISQKLNMPLIAAGGCGNLEHGLKAFKNGANAIAAGSIFYWVGESIISIKKYLNDSGINVRMT